MFESLADYFNALAGRLESLKDADYVAGGAAQSVLALQLQRIFDDGLAADGTPIGTYSDAYLQRRIVEFKRGDSRRVILTATAQMRNDYQVLRGSGFVGFGFNNPENGRKAYDNEKRFKKRIFALTDAEKNTLLKLVEKRLAEIRK